MTSLTEVYRGGRREASPRRLYFGVGLFLVGAVLTVAGLVVGTSSAVAVRLGLDVYQAREVAGVLAGVGLPVSFVGLVTVVPQAGRRLRAVGIAGAVVALFGVVLFVWAYPETWYGLQPDYTFPVTAVYFAGALTSLWCLFTAVANFKTRNDPGGTVKLEITKEGATRVVEVSNDRLRDHLGGIGFFGGTPDGDVETQTNRPDGSAGGSGGASMASVSSGGHVSSGYSGSSSSSGSTGSSRSTGSSNASGSSSATGSSGSRSSSSQTTASDGGATTTANASGGAELDDGSAEGDGRSASNGGSTATSGPWQDSYCGNCSYFQYVRTADGEMRPYCGFHGDVMDDMDPCQRWEPNTQ